QGAVRGGHRRQQDRDPAGGREAVRRARAGRAHADRAWQGEAHRPLGGPALQLEESHRDARRGRHHRLLRGGIEQMRVESRKSKGSGPVPGFRLSPFDFRLPKDERTSRMALKIYKPTSPGRRGMMGFDFTEIAPKGKSPEKSLLEHKTATGGRNNQGRITSRFRGGGHKRRYRVIDWRRDKLGVPARVLSIEYDPNRSARIALLQYRDGERRYILSPDGLSVGDTVVSSKNAD